MYARPWTFHGMHLPRTTLQMSPTRFVTLGTHR